MFLRGTPYFLLMAYIKTPECRLADEKRRARAAKIRAGQITGLFEKGSRNVHPEIRTLIDEALAERARKSSKVES